jgi:DNA-binding transcriptional MerR regulator
MKESKNVIGAFSEEHAEKLTGISKSQLRRWDRIGFLKPSYGQADRGEPFSRLYSFRDLVSLRVLNDLRNNKKVPLQHLRKVSEYLSHLGDARWTSTSLYVLGRRVVFEDPATRLKSEIVSGQRVLDIPR